MFFEHRAKYGLTFPYGFWLARRAKALDPKRIRVVAEGNLDLLNKMDDSHEFADSF